MTDVGQKRPSSGPKTSSSKLSVLSAVACYLLLLGNALWLLQVPQVGVADNGDFWRVARPAGLDHVDAHALDGRFVDAGYKVAGGELLSGGSSASCVAWLAARLGGKDGVLDIRWMGGVQILILTALLTLALWSRLPPPLVLLVTLVFLDAAYLPFLNSFYADGTLFLALLGSALWFAWLGQVDGRLSHSGALAVVALAVMGGWTKAQYSFLPLAMSAGLLIACAVGRARPRGGRWALASLLLAAVAVAAPAWFLVGPGPHFPEVNRYHAIYGGILRVSSNPELTLEALGVPKEYWGLPRRDVFSGDVPIDHPVHRAIASVSRWQVASQYLADPAAIGRALDLVVGELSARASHERGTRPRGVRGAKPGPRRWDASRLRALVMSGHPRVAWILFAIWMLGLLAHSMSRKALAVACPIWFLLVWSAAGVALTVLGDGFVSLRQHLIGFRLGLDLMAAIGTYYTFQVVASGAKELRRRRIGKTELGAGREELLEGTDGP